MLDGLRILLAEDNPTNQMVATQMLESLGASVIVANDGAEALEIVEVEPFDVLLVDIEMPRVSGIELLRRMRAREDDLAAKPMIALTAYVMREHRAAIDAAGADGVIAKPILSIEQFGNEIRRYMRPRANGAAPDAEVNGAAAGASAVIDRGVYDTLADSIGTAAMEELLEKVVADTQSARDRLARAQDAMDMDEIRAVSHILISVAGAIGAQQVQQQARRLNTAAIEDDQAATASHLPDLIGHIGHMLDHIQDGPPAG